MTNEKKHPVLWFLVILFLILVIVYISLAASHKIDWNPVKWFGKDGDGNGKGGNGDVCKVDTDCKTGYHCVNGKCQKIGGGGCKVSKDCPEHQSCVDGKCQLVGCSKDTDCPKGEVCYGGQCVLPSDKCVNGKCETGKVCVNGMCVDHDNSCHVDSDCKDNYYCYNNQCTAPCGNAYKCPAGSVCENNKCVPHPHSNSCKSSADCKPGFYCDPSTKECVKECKTASDCPRGYDCKNRQCVKHVDPGTIVDGVTYVINHPSTSTYLTLGGVCAYDPNKYGMGHFDSLSTGSDKGYQSFTAHQASSGQWYFSITFDNNNYYLARDGNGNIVAERPDGSGNIPSSALWVVEKVNNSSLLSDPKKSVMLSGSKVNISPHPVANCQNEGGCADIFMNVAKMVAYNSKGDSNSLFTVAPTQNKIISPYPVEIESGKWYNIESPVAIAQADTDKQYLIAQSGDIDAAYGNQILFGPDMPYPNPSDCECKPSKETPCVICVLPDSDTQGCPYPNVTKVGNTCAYYPSNIRKFKIDQQSGSETFSLFSSGSKCEFLEPKNKHKGEGYLAFSPSESESWKRLYVSQTEASWMLDKYGRLMSPDQKYILSSYAIPIDYHSDLGWAPEMIGNMKNSEICKSLRFNFSVASEPPFAEGKCVAGNPTSYNCAIM